MWRIVDYAKAATLGLAIAGMLTLAQPAQAMDSTVVVQVCGPAAISQLEIIEPESDTVFRQLPITLSGHAELVGQVEVYVDGAYHKVVAIPIGSTEFSVDVDLSAGTHAIEVRGASVCDGAELNDQVVVTYDPPAAPTSPVGPSKGSETPTVINPALDSPVGQGGVVVSNLAPIENDLGNDGNWFTSQWNSFFGPGFGGWLIHTTDIDTTWQRMSTSWLRIVLFFGGLILTISAGALSGGLRCRRIGWRVTGIVLVLASLLLVL